MIWRSYKAICKPCNNAAAAAAAKSLQLCLTLCNPIDGSPLGSPVPGILRARTLEWVAISFSNAYKWKVKVKSISRVQLLVTPWTAAHQARRPWDFPGKSTGVGCHCLLLSPNEWKHSAVHFSESFSSLLFLFFLKLKILFFIGVVVV